MFVVTNEYLAVVMAYGARKSAREAANLAKAQLEREQKEYKKTVGFQDAWDSAERNLEQAQAALSEATEWKIRAEKYFTSARMTFIEKNPNKKEWLEKFITHALPSI